MANDIEASLRRVQGLAGKLETNHPQVDQMMKLMIADGLAAMRYGQFGNGNTPDPTSQAAFSSRRIVDDTGYGREVIVWRDHRPEDDQKRYFEIARTVEALFEEWDSIRQRYMSANMDIKNRLDPTDWCRTHYHLQIYEGHRRFKGDRCKICQQFFEENGRDPTPTEADHYHRHGRWPHKLVDPKARKVV